MRSTAPSSFLRRKSSGFDDGGNTMEYQLNEALRELRASRGLSLSEAAQRAKTSKSSLRNWEHGRTVPAGRSLDRLLDALEAKPRARAHLLAAADPSYARLELAHTPLGAPVDVGMVLRAMRARRGVTQADLARRIGKTQSAVAKWESGESELSAETIHALGFALGATIEETLALASARNEGSGNVPEDVAEVCAELPRKFSAPLALYDVISLGWEAELWRRSVRDFHWQTYSCRLIGYRVDQWVYDGALGNVASEARRAIRMATTSEALESAVPALSALAALAHYGKGSLAEIAKTASDWAERIPPSNMRGWALKIQATCVGATGKVREGAAIMERSIETTTAAVARVTNVTERQARLSRMEAMCAYYLDVRRPGEAGQALEEPFDADFNPFVYVGAVHGTGRAASGAEMAALRARVRNPRFVGRKPLEDFETLEREQARLHRGETPSASRRRSIRISF